MAALKVLLGRDGKISDAARRRALAFCSVRLWSELSEVMWKVQDLLMAWQLSCSSLASLVVPMILPGTAVCEHRLRKVSPGREDPFLVGSETAAGADLTLLDSGM